VDGTGFVEGSAVTWSGRPRPGVFTSHQQLKAFIGDEAIERPNTASVALVSPPPGGGTSNVQYFQITTPGFVTMANAASYAGVNPT